MADGTSTASRVVGGGFVRPVINDNDDSTELIIFQGVHCEMPFTVKYVLPDTKAPEKLKESIQNEVLRVLNAAKNSFSLFELKSEISTINNLDVEVRHKMTKPMRIVITAAEEIYNRTKGAFDPGLSPLIQMYKSALVALDEHEGRVTEKNKGTGVLSTFTKLTGVELASDMEHARQNEERLRNFFNSLFRRGVFGSDEAIRTSIETLKSRSSFSSFGLSDDKRFIWKKEKLAKLDLNGIAKGWAVDEIVARLNTNFKIQNMYVEWAGDIKVKGKHPQSREWHVVLPEPPSLDLLEERAKSAGVFGHYSLELFTKPKDRKEQKNLALLSLKDGQAVATSGDYEQLFLQGSRLVSHIFSPSKGQLSELNMTGIAQSTVVNRSCMYADALATGNGYRKAMYYPQKLKLAAMALVDPLRARKLLEPLRTGLQMPVIDFWLYARYASLKMHRIVSLHYIGRGQESFD